MDLASAAADAADHDQMEHYARYDSYWSLLHAHGTHVRDGINLLILISHDQSSQQALGTGGRPDRDLQLPQRSDSRAIRLITSNSNA